MPNLPTFRQTTDFRMPSPPQPTVPIPRQEDVPEANLILGLSGVISEALKRREERRKNSQQIDAISKITGMSFPKNIAPDTALTIFKTKEDRAVKEKTAEDLLNRSLLLETERAKNARGLASYRSELSRNLWETKINALKEKGLTEANVVALRNSLVAEMNNAPMDRQEEIIDQLREVDELLKLAVSAKRGSKKTGSHAQGVKPPEEFLKSLGIK